MSRKIDQNFDLNYLLARLQGVDRKICEMMIEGYSKREIARACGISVKTVLRRSRRVMKPLARAYGLILGGEDDNR